MLLLGGCLALGLVGAAAAQSKPPGPLKFPTLLPPWEPEWVLNRSTIAQPCNYSGWFDVDLAAQFGVVSFDWANHENSYRSRAFDLPGAPVYPDDADLVTQARMVKAKNNRTKVFVYRQGQGLGVNFGKQAHEVLTDPRYEGFWLKTVNGTEMPGTINHTDGRRIAGTFGGQPEPCWPSC